MVRYARYSHGGLVDCIGTRANWIAIVAAVSIEVDASSQYVNIRPYEWVNSLLVNGSLTPPRPSLLARLVNFYFMLNC